MNIEEKKADFMRRFKASRAIVAEQVRKQNHFVCCNNEAIRFSED